MAPHPSSAAPFLLLLALCLGSGILVLVVRWTAASPTDRSLAHLRPHAHTRSRPISPSDTELLLSLCGMLEWSRSLRHAPLTVCWRRWCGDCDRASRCRRPPQPAMEVGSGCCASLRPPIRCLYRCHSDFFSYHDCCCAPQRGRRLQCVDSARVCSLQRSRTRTLSPAYLHSRCTTSSPLRMSQASTSTQTS
jgi:hypothetical protein